MDEMLYKFKLFCNGFSRQFEKDNGMKLSTNVSRGLWTIVQKMIFSAIN